MRILVTYGEHCIAQMHIHSNMHLHSVTATVKAIRQMKHDQLPQPYVVQR
jgi:hypothetical protein